MTDAAVMTLWRARQSLVLASGSRTRADLLRAAAIPLVIDKPDVDERALEAGVPQAEPQAIALALATAKAIDVSRRHPGALVLGADQTLHQGGSVFHKPIDRDAARAALRRLAGATHVLSSAYAIVQDGTILASGVQAARMTMRPLSEQTLETYLAAAGDAILGSVGCYQLEGLGVHLFDDIDGDHFTILGLPLVEVLAALRRLGALET
jgi:septum formation protein